MCGLPHKIGCTHGVVGSKIHLRQCITNGYVSNQRIQNHTTNEYVSVFINYTYIKELDAKY